MIKPYNFDYLNGVIFADKEKEPIKWSRIFNNNNRLIVEAGCGNGHFLNKKAFEEPNYNYIGIDLKKKRIIRCREKEIKYNNKNIKWVCGEAFKALNELFSEETISVIYMIFPDPWPKRRHYKHRLFNREFINQIYLKLNAEGIFIFITDFEDYFKTGYNLIINEKRFNISNMNEQNINELTNSFFGEKWRKDNRKFYGFKLVKI